MQNEKVLAVEAKHLEEIGLFQGFHPDASAYYPLVKQSLFIDRAEAEQDENWKQIIPYVMVIRMDGAVLHYRRASHIQENRLAGKFSVGFGGHINPEDGPEGSFDTHRNCVIRELREELDLEIPEDLLTTGCLYNTLTSVDRVHFGFIHMIFVTQERAGHLLSRESAILNPQFVNVNDWKPAFDQYEGWSQLCMSHLNEMLVQTLVGAERQMLKYRNLANTLFT